MCVCVVYVHPCRSEELPALAQLVVDELCPTEELQRRMVSLQDVCTRLDLLGKVQQYGVASPPQGLEDLSWHLWEAKFLAHLPKDVRNDLREKRRLRKEVCLFCACGCFSFPLVLGSSLFNAAAPSSKRTSLAKCTEIMWRPSAPRRLPPRRASPSVEA